MEKITELPPELIEIIRAKIPGKNILPIVCKAWSFLYPVADEIAKQVLVDTIYDPERENSTRLVAIYKLFDRSPDTAWDVLIYILRASPGYSARYSLHLRGQIVSNYFVQAVTSFEGKRARIRTKRARHTLSFVTSYDNKHLKSDPAVQIALYYLTMMLDPKRIFNKSYGIYFFPQGDTFCLREFYKYDYATQGKKYLTNTETFDTLVQQLQDRLNNLDEALERILWIHHE